MGDLGAEGGSEDACRRNGQQCRQMNVSQHHGKLRQARFTPTRDDVTECPGCCNGKAQCSRCAYGVMHLDVAPNHEGNGNKTASGAD